MRVADYIMQRLAAEGIRHLFMVTGRGILYLSDAAAKESGIQCVCVHHEQAGAYAAMAYAQYNENLGACLVSTGCAGTNAVTGVLCAWQDGIPCIFISGQNSLHETVRHRKIAIRTFGQQEADIVSVVSPITKYAVMLEDPCRVAFELEKALYLARHGRKGPVWLDIPLDIQNMRIEPEALEHFIPSSTAERSLSDDAGMVYRSLMRAKRPVVMIGAGVRSAGANAVFCEFAEKWRLPVVYGSNAVDIFHASHELSMGCVGAIGGNRAANFCVQNSDFLLVIGNRLNSMTAGNAPEKFAREASVTVVDIDPAEHQKGTVRIDRFIEADAKDFLVALNQYPAAGDFAAWQEKCRHWKAVFPKCPPERCGKNPMDLYEAIAILSEQLAPDAAIVCDAGLEELLTPTVIQFRGRQRLIQPASQGAMGYALPAGVGAWLASGKQTVIVTGDGSVMMNLQELQTIAYHKYPVKLFIINNNCYAVIRKRQQDLFRTRTVGTDGSNGVSTPDFGRVALAFGLKYQKFSDSHEMKTQLLDILNTPEAVVCEIMTTPEQTVLHSSFARTANGRFVQRPLEDQSPFLDRSLFLSEMLIEPIDQ